MTRSQARATIRVACGLRLPRARASAYSRPAQGDCMRALWAKAVRAVRAQVLRAPDPQYRCRVTHGTPIRCPAALPAPFCSAHPPGSPAELTGSALAGGPRQQRRSRQLSGMAGGKAMCLRCGVVEYPYRRWPSGPAGPGDYGSPPDASPSEYEAAPTGGFFGIGARGRDYRMTTGRWDRGRAVGGNILPICVSSAKEPRRTRCVPCRTLRAGRTY